MNTIHTKHCLNDEVGLISRKIIDIQYHFCLAVIFSHSSLMFLLTVTCHFCLPFEFWHAPKSPLNSYLFFNLFLIETYSHSVQSVSPHEIRVLIYPISGHWNQIMDWKGHRPNSLRYGMMHWSKKQCKPLSPLKNQTITIAFRVYDLCITWA